MSAALSTLRRRRTVGRAAGLCLGLALLFLLDGMTGGLRDDLSLLRGLPGEALAVSAAAPMAVERPEQIAVEARPGFTVAVEQMTQGYVLGGRLFTGTVRPEPGTPAGDYPLVFAYPPDDKGVVHRTAFTVRVYADAAARRRESRYFSERLLAVPPFPAAGVLTALGLAGLAAVFLLSTRLEAELARERMSEVRKLWRRPEGLELEFGLGSRHGLARGDSVLVLGEDLRPLGRATVTEVREDEAKAASAGIAGAGHGSIVSLAVPVS